MLDRSRAASGGPLGSADRMADECSPMRIALRVKFPDHQGKYREFSRFQAPRPTWQPKKAARSLWFLSKFPNTTDQEFQNVIRELFCGIREFPGDNRVSTVDPVPRAASEQRGAPRPQGRTRRCADRRRRLAPEADPV